MTWIINMFGVCVIFSFFHILYASYLIKGIPPEYSALYKPSEKFTCLDKSATISFSWVNDDYCDCRDGSDEPGTAACPNMRFYCTNDGHKSVFISSSFVNDGVCDCCDGSDEYLGFINCTNTCGDLARDKEAKLVEKRESFIAGHETYKVYVAKKAIELEEQARLQKEAERLRAEQEEADRLRAEEEARLRVELREPEPEATTEEQAKPKEDTEQKRAEIEEANREEVEVTSVVEPPFPDVEQQKEQTAEENPTKEHLTDEQRNLDEPALPDSPHKEEEELVERPSYDSNEEPAAPEKITDYGPDNGFLMLTEPAVGCLNLHVKEYIYSLCAFKNAYQRGVNDPEPGVLLGNWNRWLDHPEGSEVWAKEQKMELPYKMMLYDQGSYCWNGPSRSVKVHVRCGSKNRLLMVDEPSRCVYEYTMETPGACHHHPEKLLSMYHTEL